MFNKADYKLEIFGGLIANMGTIRATPGNHLSIQYQTINNTSGDEAGVMEALPNGLVTLENSTIEGGIVRGIAAAPDSGEGNGIIQGAGGLLKNVTLEGNVGNEISSFSIAGQIENRGLFAFNQLDVTEDAEIVGGVVYLRGETNISSSQSTLTLTNTVVQVGQGYAQSRLSDCTIVNNSLIQGVEGYFSFGSKLSVVNHGIVQAEPGSTLRFTSLSTDVGQQGFLYAKPDSIIQVTSMVRGTIGCPAGEICGTGTGEVSAGYVQDVTKQRLLASQQRRIGWSNRE
ncbi:hypothetical protein [Aeoliella mucimassa]|uniref:Uncharacterized protein n=1 Tax=Aeoliella mucimassa TaxID=2527972 RepID=A0A518AWL3_9BACT|nr:hypothetical protein [Aeoliella mucimassa]QDU59106.1 hypothetical protein Pan181_53470 [Aeoliella mucimassa]